MNCLSLQSELNAWPGPWFSHERLQASLSSVLHTACVYETESNVRSVHDALLRHFPQIDPHTWVDRAFFGGIYVNGKVAKLFDELPCPYRIEYMEPRYDYQNPGSYYPSFSQEWIVHEDEDILVVYKPAGISGLPNREQIRWNLKVFLEEHYGHPLHFPSRLDTSTAGLVLVSRSSRMHNLLQQQFESRQVEKIYLCELEVPDAPASLTVDIPIGKDSAHPILRKPYGDDAKTARSHFQLLASRGNARLYKVKLETGRTHQIRVHACAALGPLRGDNFYGGPEHEELHLLSFSAACAHPFRSEAPIQTSLPKHLWPKWLFHWEKPLVDLFPLIR